jgi:hypothetical protein
MFGKRSVKCPITVEDQKWISNSLNWINDNVVNIINQPTIEPTKQFFNWEFNGKEEDAYFALEKIVKYAHFNTNNFQLHFYNREEEFELMCRLPQKNNTMTSFYFFSENNNMYTLGIGTTQLKNKIDLITGITRLLCYHLLVNLKSMSVDAKEVEGLIDLLAIAFGFGIFIYSTMQSSEFFQHLSFGGCSSYLPQQVSAYVMAEIEMRKNNSKTPIWIQNSSTNFKSDFKKSMKYLKNEDQSL